MDRCPEAYRIALDIHHSYLREVVKESGGKEIQESGDGFYFAFEDVMTATEAALEIQKGLPSLAWPTETGPLLVRMSLNQGKADFLDGQYRGAMIHQASRLLAAANGGQILCTPPVAEMVAGLVNARRLGSYLLRGFKNKEEVYQLGADQEFAPLRLEHARKNNLPATSGKFVGHSQLLPALINRLDPNGNHQVTVLTGSGGIGKTRLALEAARHLLQRYENNVVFVSLTEVTETSSALDAILEAVGIKDKKGENPMTALMEFFGRDSGLLLLDNAENMGAGLATLVTHIVASIPEVRLLVTSRVQGGVSPDAEVQIAPLECPPTHCALENLENYDCVRLFMERARSVRKDITISKEQVTAIITITHALEGLPLAVEIAAARIHVMSIEELAADMDKASWLQSGNAAMERIFEWSCSLLPEPIRVFFARLSVFRGGWNSKAALHVGQCDDPRIVLAYLHYLLSCALIRNVGGTQDVVFSMLEPVRQLAKLRLGQDIGDAKTRHSQFFRKLARELDASFETPQEAGLLATASWNTANLLTALEYEKDDKKFLLFAIDLHPFALHRSCNVSLRKLLAQRLHAGVHVNQMDIVGKAWHALAALARTDARSDEAGTAFLKAAEIFDSIGEDRSAIVARLNLAALSSTSTKEDPIQVSLDTLSYFQEKKALPECAGILNVLAWQKRKAGFRKEAVIHAQESLEITRQCGILRERAFSYYMLGQLCLDEGDGENACCEFGEALKILVQLGHEASLPEALANLACSAFMMGNSERGMFLLGAMTTIQSALGPSNKSIPASLMSDIKHGETTAIQTLGQTEAAKQKRAGAMAPRDQWFASSARSLEFAARF